MPPAGNGSLGVAAQHREWGVAQQSSAGLLGQFAFQCRLEALAWLKATAGWSPVAVLEPDHNPGGADEGDHEHPGDAVRVDLAR